MKLLGQRKRDRDLRYADGHRDQGGAFYALIVFLIGFIFGTLRVLLLAPRFGETAAVILETPVMLAASWFVCRWCVGRVDVPRTVRFDRQWAQSPSWC